MSSSGKSSCSAPIITPYSARDVERAFGFIDANRDGRVGREEASGFRNAARYFDAAAINKNGELSLDKFRAALNQP